MRRVVARAAASAHIQPMDDEDPQDAASRSVAITPEKAAAATGALSEAAQLHLVRQVLSCLWMPKGTPQDEVDRLISAAMERMLELAPADPAEGMLAAQMIATHEAAMECLRRAMLDGQTFAGRDQAGASAACPAVSASLTGALRRNVMGAEWRA